MSILMRASGADTPLSERPWNNCQLCWPPDERNSTARALCVELARTTGGSLQWRMVRLIGPALGQDEAAVDAAIA
jgi:hypothetical protein